MLTVCDALVSCAASRPTCGDDRSPRGRIPSCLAGGEPGGTRANLIEPSSVLVSHRKKMQTSQAELVISAG